MTTGLKGFHFGVHNKKKPHLVLFPQDHNEFIEQNTTDVDSEQKCDVKVWPAGVTVVTVRL